MCGIVGCLGTEAGSHLERMVDAVVHRGPDGRGTWSAAGIGLGAARLAIVGLDGGAQPMHLGDLALVANAEIYNHRELRAELEAEGARFRTECDVEVLLHAYQHWGLDLLQRLEGFFAFALWDGSRRRLLLARDRFGIAPMVWTRVGGQLLFASEVKGLLVHPGVNPGLDVGTLDDVLALRYAPGRRTWWEGVEHLPPGHLMVVEQDDATPQPIQWWSPPPSGSEKSSPGQGDAVTRLERALKESVTRRVHHGDAAVGLYLSGGLDSSLVAALGPEGLPAFSHGYDEATDEHPRAREVAGTLQLPWTPVFLGPSDLDALPDVVRAVEQPVANSDILGLWALAREASKEVKAVLCGEGADELFGSYPHQQLLHRLWSLPTWMRRGLAATLPWMPSSWIQGQAAYPGAATDPGVRGRWVEALQAEDVAASHRAVSTLFTAPERGALYTDAVSAEVVANPGLAEVMERPLHQAEPHSVLDALIDHGLSGWLDGYHLGRENRIAMAHGLEARYPYLDSNVVDAALPLGLGAKLGPGSPRDKWALRQVAQGHLGAGIAGRAKGPVRVPLSLFGSRWTEMVGDLLTEERVRRRGLFRPETVLALRDRQAAEPFLVGRQLFALVLVEVWHDAFA